MVRQRVWVSAESGGDTVLAGSRSLTRRAQPGGSHEAPDREEEGPSGRLLDRPPLHSPENPSGEGCGEQGQGLCTEWVDAGHARAQDPGGVIWLLSAFGRPFLITCPRQSAEVTRGAVGVGWGAVGCGWSRKARIYPEPC